jgi:hypothetical protein
MLVFLSFYFRAPCRHDKLSVRDASRRILMFRWVRHRSNETNIAVFGLRGSVKSSGNNTRFGVVASMVVSLHGSVCRSTGFDKTLNVNFKNKDKVRMLLMHGRCVCTKIYDVTSHVT